MLAGVPGIAADTIFAVVDPAGLLDECREDNNSTSAPFIPDTAQGVVAVVTDKMAYPEDTLVQITGTVTNPGFFPYTLNAQLFVEDGNGVLIEAFPQESLGTLTSGAEVMIAASWNTENFLAGEYRVRGLLTDANGATVGESIALFNIVQEFSESSPVFVRTTTNALTYHTTDQVQLETLIRNVTSNAVFENLTLEIIITGPDEEIFNETTLVSSLVPGQSFEFSKTVLLGGVTAGIYQVVYSLKDSNNVALDQGTVNFSVENNLALALSGAVTAQHDVLLMGESQICDFTISNNGTQDLTALPVQLLLVSMTTGAIVTNDPSSIDLAAGGTQNFMNGFSTAGLAVGDYACVIQATLDGQETSLANAVFRVDPPPIQYSATLTNLQASRTLILMDPVEETCSMTRALTLRGDFHLPVDALTTVTAKILGPSGELIDSEMAVADGFFDPVDLNAGTPANIEIIGLTPSSIEIRMGHTTLFDGNYEFVVTYSIDGTDYDLTSNPVLFRCGEPPVVGDAMGAFDITVVDTVEQVIVPHQNADCPYPWHVHSHQNGNQVPETPYVYDQRAFLETLLAGRSHTIVDTIDDFRMALLSGQYQQYLILSERVHLDQWSSESLREAAYRGEGVIYASGNIPVQEAVQEALGIYYHDGQHGAPKDFVTGSGVALTDSPLSPEGTVTFGLDRWIPIIDLTTAAPVGIVTDP
ncbi:MAG: hypothetical protein KC553_15135 [Nitrospina sp.]|nr:hypothetical protein [Nitrospina sp.]